MLLIKLPSEAMTANGQAGIWRLRTWEHVEEPGQIGDDEACMRAAITRRRYTDAQYSPKDDSTEPPLG